MLRAEISIPPLHRIGIVESPSALRLQFREHPGRHVVFAHLNDISAEEFARWPGGADRADEILIYVPGINNTFDTNVRRAAVRAWDLRWQGVMVLLDWPSAGDVAGILRDLTTAEWAAPSLAAMTQLPAIQNARRRCLIARDVGCRLALAGLITAAARIDELILVQPLVDRDVLTHQLRQLLERVGRTTVYVAPGTPLTRTLAAFSSSMPGQRPGDTLDLPNVDVVDVADSGLLGQALSGAEHWMDVRGVLDGVEPARRPGLMPRERGWRLE
jgi:esterase/lipase superfamily enzyme